MDNECAREDESCYNKDLAVKLKVAALAAILLASTLGVLMPILGKRVHYFRPDGNFFFITKAFAAGVILATAFIHMLPDAMETLANPCLPEDPWAKFPFSGLFAMVAALCTLVVDFAGSQYYENKHLQAAAAHASAAGDAGGQQRQGGAVEEVEAGKPLPIVDMHSHSISHAHAHGKVMPFDADETDAKLIQVRHKVVSQVRNVLVSSTSPGYGRTRWPTP